MSSDYEKYLDQISKEPLTDPYTLTQENFSETYNKCTWVALITGRKHYSPLLKLPIRTYTNQNYQFNPLFNHSLKQEVEKWLTTTQGQEYCNIEQ